MRRTDLIRYGGLAVAVLAVVVGVALIAVATRPLLAGSVPEAATATAAEPQTASAPAEAPSPRAPKTLVFPDGSRVSVEAVGTTKGGAMDVPRDPSHAGWWKSGPMPGQEGIAVLDGHSGWNGRAVAFAKLEGLKTGDVVQVLSSGGTSYAFTVWEEHRYPADANVPSVFSGRDGSWLNLITCVGTWDASRQTHSQRLVVSCKLVPERD